MGSACLVATHQIRDKATGAIDIELCARSSLPLMGSLN
jgi:hypothetical protein